jgi:hypothetical protein
MIDFKVLEFYIVLVGKTPNECLSFLDRNGIPIYGLKPLTHYEVLQRGISKYIENKPKKEKTDIIQYLLKEEYKLEHEKYFSRSWQKSHSPYDMRFIQLPPKVNGIFQDMILKETRIIRFCKGISPQGISYGHNHMNIESFHPLTDSQRKFILNYIDIHNISPDKIYIDDQSEQQSIKRQLGLQFF